MLHISKVYIRTGLWHNVLWKDRIIQYLLKMHDLNFYHLRVIALDYPFKLTFFFLEVLFCPTSIVLQYCKQLSQFQLHTCICILISINVYIIHLINYSKWMLFIVATHLKSYVPLKVYSSLTQLICQLFRFCFMRLHSTLADTTPCI